jgi:hypothetical protein
LPEAEDSENSWDSDGDFGESFAFLAISHGKMLQKPQKLRIRLGQ